MRQQSQFPMLNTSRYYRRPSSMVGTMVAIGAACCSFFLITEPVNAFILPSNLRNTMNKNSPRSALLMAREGEWSEMNGDIGHENPWAMAPGEAGGDDWYMNTARIHYLREMEKLGQELHELTEAYNGATNNLNNNQQGAAATIDHERVIREAANQEEVRRLEVMVAENCAQNWREEPVFNRPVGFVPGNKKVQQVKLCNNRVMYGSDGGFIGLANALDGKDVFREQAHSALVTALDCDDSTGWMVSAADDGLVNVYRENNEGIERVQSLRLHTNRVVSAEVLDHKLGMTASVDGKIIIFELDNGQIVQEIWASDTLLAASVCKGYIFVGLMSGIVEAFSIRNGGRSAFRYIAQRCPIRSLRAFPMANSIKIVAGGQDGAVRQFHVRSVMSTDVWKVPTDRSFDDRLVLLCNTHVDHETREVDQGFVLKGHKGPVIAVACDEEKVISASEDGLVTVWDAFKGTVSYKIRQHADGDLVSAVDFNERYLVVDGTRGKVYVWDYAHGPPPRRAAPSSKKRSRGGRASRAGRPPPPPPKASSSPEAGPVGGSATPPRPPFPFIGGWNLGGGPTDFVGGAAPSDSNDSSSSNEGTDPEAAEGDSE